MYKHKNSMLVVNRAIKQVAVQIMHKNYFNQVRQKVKNHQPWSSLELGDSKLKEDRNKPGRIILKKLIINEWSK